MNATIARISATLKNAGFDVKVNGTEITVSLNREVSTMEVWTASGFKYAQSDSRKVNGAVVISL